MKIALLSVCFGFCIGLPIQADQSDIFSYDAGYIEQQLSQLTALEEIFTSNPDLISQSDLYFCPQHSGCLYSGSSLAWCRRTENPEKALGIPSFLWGCVIGWPGVLVVYFVTKDDDQTRKAALGCIAGTSLWLIAYLFYCFTLFNRYYLY